MIDGLLTLAWFVGLIAGSVTLALIVFAPELFRARSRRSGCTTCGYDMNGLGQNAPCPECGTRVVPKTSVRMRSSEWALVMAYVFPLISIFVVGLMLAPDAASFAGVVFFLLFHAPSMVACVFVAHVLAIRGMPALSIGFSATASLMYSVTYGLLLRFGIDHSDAQSAIGVMLLPIAVGPVLGYALLFAALACGVATRVSRDSN